MKKTLSIILAILMIVTTIPMAFAADDTPDFSDAKVLTANEKGILCIDGVQVEYDTYTVASTYFGYDQYLPSGKYKLSGDVTMHKNGFINIEEGENVSVDLNGYTWNCNECTYTDGTFSVYDTSKDEKGKITASYGLILVRGDGEFNLYSGTIEDSKGGVILRVLEGTANLYGGKLKSNEYTIGHILSENAKINLGGTVLESEEGYPEIESFILSSKVPQGIINVADYTGESLTVEIVADYTGESLAGKIKILEGVENAQEAEKYTIKFYKNDSYYLDKIEYNEETGEMFAYTAKYAFTQQPSAENGYTVDFNNPDATFQWYEVEETILTPDNVTAIEEEIFENEKWLHGGGYVEFFTVDVEAGDMITASTTSDCSFDLNVFTEDYSIDEYVIATGKASVTIDSDAEVIVGINVDVTNETTEFEFELIRTSEPDETETDKTLQNPECGKTYVCKTSAGENVYLSDVVTVGHNIVSVDTQAPTCTEIGWDAYEYCTACDYTTYAEKAPHSDTLVKVDAKAPTCTEIGWDAYEYCTACDYTTYAEKAPHSDTLVKVDAKAPTCTEIGWDAYEYCTACDYTTYVEIVDPDAHDYTNHYCKRCGKAEDGYYAGACGANGDNLNWSLDSDGVLTISGEGEMQEISSYKQQPWKDYSSDIKEVVIEEGVTKIAELAFYALFELEKVTISSTAEFEDFCYCFISCSSLKEFIVSPANPYYCTDEYGVIFSKDKKTLLRGVDLSDVDYVIPDTVTSVAKQAFDGIKIKSLIVNVTSMDMFLNAAIDKLIVDCANVERSAFAYTTIGEVVLTNKVIEISKYAFNGSIITSAHYLGDPANLTIEANENESLTDVLHYCEHKEALAPTCTEIGWEAYEYCTACDYTTKVEKEALDHKDTLVQVDAKAPTCTEIGWDAYEYCTACDYTTYVEIPALTHTDANCDYKCDYNCGYEYETLDFSDAKVLSSDADGYLCIDGVKIDEDSARSAQYLPTGKYKLEGDIISNDCIIWILAEEQVIINLNGYKWTLGDSITLDGELSLYDLSEGETGKIVASTNWGNVNMQEESSVLNLYSGTLESTGGCALRFQKGNANLYGGKLKSDKYVIRNNVAKGNKGIDIDGTVLECGDGYAQILCSSTSNSVTESFIDVSDYTGDYLTVEFEVKKSGKYTIFEGIKNAQEADKYSIDVKYEERHEIFFDKTEYDEATGEKCVYIKSNAFVQQPSPANNYTVGFSNPDASFQWYEVEETSSSVHTAVNDMTIYTNNFKAGDILKVSTDSEIKRVILYSDYGSLDLDEDTKTAMIKFDTDVTVEFVPSVLDAENPVKLEFSIINETLLDGATGKTLKNPEFRKEYYCKATVGKFVYTSDIVAGHYIVRVDAKAPTCTEIGWDAYVYCIDCNYTSYVEKEALNHKDTLVKVDAKAPTCTEIGWDAYEYCTACDYTTYIEKEALNHKDTLVKVDAKAPTCTESGWDAYEYCTACDYTTYVEIPVDADAHDYTNHYCKTCGKVEDGYYAGTCGAENADDVIWSLDSEGTLTISGEGEYDVPYLNAPWKAYGENIKNVVIEEGITNIKQGSFYALPNAVSLSIPSTVTTIECLSNNSFAEFKVADGNNYYSVIDGVLFNYDKTELIMYPAKKADETYTVPDGVTNLGRGAFNLAENLKTLNICDDVTTIKDSCFSHAHSLENINFGENVEVVEKSAFYDTGLKTVVLPEKLTEIPYGVFWSCAKLETLVIGSNVTSIDESVIMYCDKLKTLHFTGTEEQWQAITKPADSEDLINTIEVHFGALEEKDATEAACGEAGHTAGLYCDECNAYLTGEEIPATGEHTYVDGKCNVCGHECTHYWDDGVLTRPTYVGAGGIVGYWQDGYYTYTCDVCDESYNETVKRADYTAFDAIIGDFTGAIRNNNLLESIRDDLNAIYDENTDVVIGNRVESEQAEVDAFVEIMKQKLEEVDAGIADGTAIKVDGMAIVNEMQTAWTLKIENDGLKGILLEYIFNGKITEEATEKQGEIKAFADSLEGSVADNADNIKQLEEMVNGFLASFENCIYDRHNFGEYKVIEDAKCGANAVEEAACWFCYKEVTREVENSALTHSFTKYEVTEEAKCGVEGKEVAYCDNGCGETDEKSIEALRHTFTKYEVTEEAKCGVEGKEVAYCDNGCGETDEKAIEALKHDIVIDEAVAPKCGETGLTQGEHCTRCDYKVEQEIVPALEHKDADGDYKCDNGCGHEFEKPAPEEPTPDTPDEPTDNACDHLCHKGGFIGFIWKIVKFFSKLFKLNPVCECGAAHY